MRQPLERHPVDDGPVPHVDRGDDADTLEGREQQSRLVREAQVPGSRGNVDHAQRAAVWVEHRDRVRRAARDRDETDLEQQEQARCRAEPVDRPRSRAQASTR